MAEQEQSVEPRFLLVKRGLYYRPDSRGYTGKKSEAGRYHENERCQLEGVDAIHEDNAAEYAPACWMETKLADKDARIAELEAQLASCTPTPDAVNADKALARSTMKPESICGHLRHGMSYTGDGHRVLFCTQCGKNLELDGKPLPDEPPVPSTPAPDKALMPEAAVGAWRTIDSAPKDRTKVDLWVVFTDWFGKDVGERLTNCLWIKRSATYEEGWHDAYGNHLEWQVDLSNPENEEVNPRNGRRVTHWMPVPNAPFTNPTPVEEPEKGATGEPVAMLLFCPKCGLQHIDEPDERTPEWDNPPHRSHLCHGCGCIWRPADIATEGVASIDTIGNADTWNSGGPAALAATNAGQMEAEPTGVSLAVDLVRIAVKAGAGEISITLDRGDLDGQMTGPWDIIVKQANGDAS